ncbi:transglycosylase SLT domain-containing protein [Gammaproteobacteria bacterium AS21]
MFIFKKTLTSALKFNVVTTPLLLIVCLSTLIGCQTTALNNEVAANTNRTSIEQAYLMYNINKKSSNNAVPGQLTKNRQDLWHLAPTLFSLNLHTQQPRVRSEMTSLLRNPTFITNTSKRAHYYFHYILKQVVKKNMPAELAMLPFIESGYNPFALSSANALGIWQFIPDTGKHYGLKSTWWYDGRRDIITSTDAALNYLQDLNRTFKGDWLLTLAAYNCGAGCVKNAQKINAGVNRKTDYWSLKLPNETARYVPKFLAINKLIKDAERYNIKLSAIANRPYFGTVNVGSQIDIQLAAKMAGISTQALYQLNPGFNRWATSPTGPHRLLIPANRAAGLRTLLANLNSDDKMNWKVVTTKPDDTLAMIATRHNTSTNILKTINVTTDFRNLNNAQLRLPKSDIKPTSFVLQHRPENFKTNSHKPPIKQLSHQHSSKKDTGKKRLVYQVKSGDSINVIAHKFSILVDDIKRWNQQLETTSYLRPNQTLILFINKSKKHLI